MLAIDHQMREMLQTPGVRSVCLVDWRGDRTLTCMGAHERSTDAAAILRAIHGGPLGAVGTVEDVVVTEPDHHLLFAVLGDSDLCVQVRMERSAGNLGFALVRLRGLARTACVPPPRRDADHPARRGRDRLRPAGPPSTSVDRSVLERVLTALRTLFSVRPKGGAVIV